LNNSFIFHILYLSVWLLKTWGDLFIKFLLQTLFTTRRRSSKSMKYNTLIRGTSGSSNWVTELQQLKQRKWYIWHIDLEDLLLVVNRVCKRLNDIIKYSTVLWIVLEFYDPLNITESDLPMTSVIVFGSTLLNAKYSASSFVQ
jgi:hypothetical protein